MKRLVAILLGCLLLSLAWAAPQQVDVVKEIRVAHDLVAQGLREYRSGQAEAAYRTVRSAYLDHVEYAEPPLRVLSPDLILKLEYRFSALWTGIKEGAPLAGLQATASEINASLLEAESVASGTGVLAPTLAATAGFTLLFREGLEAALLLAAILAYLASSRNLALRRGVWLGAGAAVLATVLTYLVATYLVAIAPVSRELISAVTSVVAVVILFYLSFWMLGQGERKKNLEFMRARVSQAVQGGSLLAIGLVSFTALYREGFETVLFYQALAVASGPVQPYMYLGMGLAALAIAVVFAALFRLERKLPTALLFRFTVSVTAVMAIAFVGNGLRAFQEAGWLPVTNVYGVLPDLGPSVASLTGLHPTLETLLGQALLALVYLVGLVLFRLRSRGQKVRPVTS